MAVLKRAPLRSRRGSQLAHDRLYVADAESNIIRSVTLPPANHVTTIAGGDLFEFGDRDGRGDDARLQHPLGVAWLDGAYLCRGHL